MFMPASLHFTYLPKHSVMSIILLCLYGHVSIMFQDGMHVPHLFAIIFHHMKYRVLCTGQTTNSTPRFSCVLIGCI